MRHKKVFKKTNLLSIKHAKNFNSSVLDQYVLKRNKGCEKTSQNYVESNL